MSSQTKNVFLQSPHCGRIRLDVCFVNKETLCDLFVIDADQLVVCDNNGDEMEEISPEIARERLEKHQMDTYTVCDAEWLDNTPHEHNDNCEFHSHGEQESVQNAENAAAHKHCLLQCRLSMKLMQRISKIPLARSRFVEKVI